MKLMPFASAIAAVVAALFLNIASAEARCAGATSDSASVSGEGGSGNGQATLPDVASPTGEDWLAHYNRGLDLLGHADCESAIAELQKAVTLAANSGNENLATAYHALGMAHFDNRQFEASLEALNQTVRLLPTDTYYRSDHGLSLLALQRFQEAGSDFKAAGLGSHVWLYIVRIRSGMPEESARAELEAAESAGVTDGATPWPMVDLFLGKQTPAEILSAARVSEGMPLIAGPGQETVTTYSNGVSCETPLYIGEYELLRGEVAAARLFFTRTINDCRVGEMQSALAFAELAVLDAKSGLFSTAFSDTRSQWLDPWFLPTVEPLSEIFLNFDLLLYWGLVTTVVAMIVWWVLRPVMIFIWRWIIGPIRRFLKRAGYLLGAVLLVLIAIFFAGLGVWLIVSRDDWLNGLAFTIGFLAFVAILVRHFWFSARGEMREIISIS